MSQRDQSPEVQTASSRMKPPRRSAIELEGKVAQQEDRLPEGRSRTRRALTQQRPTGKTIGASAGRARRRRGRSRRASRSPE
eukprot:15476785-Alexandrium_andersonii.AAC.1